MQKGQSAQPIRWGSELFQLRSSVSHENVEGAVYCRHENLFFAFEIEIDGSIRDVRALRYVGDAGHEETFLCKDRNSGIEDALVLVRATIHTRSRVHNRHRNLSIRGSVFSAVRLAEREALLNRSS